MPTVEEVDRLTALLTRLTPLGDQHIGDLITAQDWNTLVSAVIEVARALVDESTSAVPPHEHPDQVALGWLDPRLRTLVENGPVGDPAAIARVDALERGGTRLQAAIDQLTAQVSELRDRSREVATRDIEREASVNVVRRKIEGMADGRDAVAEVRATLDTVQTQVSRAVALGEALSADGAPVDLGALQTRVDGLEVLRDGLTLPTGEVLDAAALERRLAELSNTLVTQEDLNGALKDRVATLDPDTESALENRLQTKLDATMITREDALRADITSATDAKLAGVDGIVATRVADATPSIRDEVLATTRTEADARQATILTQAGADADAKVAAGLTSVRADLAGGLDGLRAELGDRVASELGDRLPAALSDLQGTVDGLRADLNGLAGKLDESAGAVSTLGARVDELDRGTTERLLALRTGLQKGIDDLRGQIGTRVGALETTTAALDTRVGALDAGLDQRVAANVQAANVATLRRVAVDTINERFGPQ